jgi:hypothetical protein
LASIKDREKIGNRTAVCENPGLEYALVLPEERYLIEVQTHKPDGGELRGQGEIERIAKECLVLGVGEGHRDQLEEVKPNSISESNAQTLTKVQQLLNRPGAVYLVE